MKDMNNIKSFFMSLKPWQIITLVSIIVITISAVVLTPLLRQYLRSKIGLDASLIITADSEDVLGVTGDTTFTIKSDTDVSASDIRDAITIEPDTDFTVDKIGDSLYKLKPKVALASDNIYRIGFQGKDKLHSWAFQVKDSFRVLATLPRHQSAGVPTNSGIEIIFSSDQFKDADKYFSISPPVKGRFEKNRRVLTFIPERLSDSTLYTVTLKSGLAVNDTDKLTTDHTFQFETSSEAASADGYRYHLNLSSTHYQFNPQEKPVFDLTIQDQTIPATATVYQFRNQDDYISAFRALQGTPIWSYLARKQSQIDTKSLNKVSEQALQVDMQNYTGFLGLPNSLNRGYYLIELKNDRSVTQSVFQVTSLTAYTEVLDNQSLFWVNHSETGSTVPGATVSFMGNKCTTSATGVCTMDTPPAFLQDNNPPQDIIITTPEEALVLVTGYNGQFAYQRHFYFGSYASDQYWSYLYTDRPIYQTSDTIQFYGLAKARQQGVDGPITVSLRNSWGDIYTSNALHYQTISLNPDALGTFAGQFSIAGLQSGWYSLELRASDKLLSSNTVHITHYVKPSYTLDLKPSSYGVISGNQISLTATANFFEGTPFTDLDLNLSGYYPERYEQIQKTNSAGQSIFTVNFPIPGSIMDYSPNTANFVLKPQNPEISDITASQNITIFSSAIHLRASSSAKSGSVASWQISANSIDLSKVQDSFSFTAPAYIASPVPAKTLNIKLYEVWYDKVQTGEYYDYITKLNLPTFQYYSRENQISSQDLTTNSAGQIIYEATIKPDMYYKLVAEVVDDQGRTTRVTDWYYPRSSSYYSGMSSFPDITLDQDKNFVVGDMVKYRVTRGSDALPDNYKYLHLTKSRGLRAHSVSQSPINEVKFEAEYIPNAYLQSVIYTGNSYILTTERPVYFDKTTRQLTIEATPDKTRYSPKDTVKLNIKVTDVEGKPVSSSLNLSVVDEAVFAIMPSVADPLSHIYRQVSTGSRSIQFSHRLPLASAMAEGGGGGGGDIRSRFPDTALFIKLETNSQGIAQAEIPLPDTVTSWRVTTHAISSDIKTGASSLKIPVSLDFFSDILLPETYHVQDQPMIGVRANSSTLPAGSAVDFQLVSESLKYDQQLSGSLNGTVYFPIGKLSDGTHKFVLTAKSGSHTDKIQKQVQVVSGYKDRYQTSIHSLTPGAGLPVPSTNSTVYLKFVDAGTGRLVADLESLRFDHRSRADVRLSAISSSQLLGLVPAGDISDYYTEDGGMSLLPYSSSDPYISVLAACQTTTSVDQIRLRSYFYKHLDQASTTLDQASLDTLGLACLGEKVLPLIKSLSDSNKIQDISRLYLALARAKLGDHEPARALYRQYLTTKSKVVDDQITLQVGDPVDYTRHSYLIAWLGSLISEDGAKNYYQFARGQIDTHEIYPLERLLYIEHQWLKKQPEPFTLTLKIKDQKVVVDSAKSQAINLITDAEALKTLVVEKITGAPEVIIGFFGPIDASQASSSFKISRSYSKAGQTTTQFGRTDTVRVNLSFQMPAQSGGQCTMITDYLPSNMRPLSQAVAMPYQQPNLTYPTNVDGQKVTFCVSPTSKPISYMARITSPGTFVADSPIIQSLATPSLFAVGTPTIIEVK
jgi:alpha-2-macroglobulin